MAIKSVDFLFLIKASDSKKLWAISILWLEKSHLWESQICFNLNGLWRSPHWGNINLNDNAFSWTDATPREPLGIWQPKSPHQRFGCPEMCALTWTMRLAPTAKEASIQDTVQNLSSGTNYVLQSYSAMRTGHRWCKWPQTVFKKTLPFFVQAIRIVLENLQTLTIKMMQKLSRRWEMLEWICL